MTLHCRGCNYCRESKCCQFCIGVIFASRGITVLRSSSLSRETPYCLVAVSEALCLKMSVMCKVCSLGLLIQVLQFISCVGMLATCMFAMCTIDPSRACAEGLRLVCRLSVICLLPKLQLHHSFLRSNHIMHVVPYL